MSNQNTGDIIIVGGGIAGLYTAYKLSTQTERKIILLENNAELGGRVQTQYDKDDNVLFEKDRGEFIQIINE